MILDMHMHTSEGSPDSRVSIFEVVERLKGLRYDGVLITDHNSYRGYEVWKESGRKDFIVIKGIEYDTKDAGHIIIILPSNIETNLFTFKGLKLETTLDIVHKLGGVLGPAHPYEYSRLGIGNTFRYKYDLGIYREFDFIEGFNSCSSERANILATMTGKYFKKQITAGSDAHRIGCIGKAMTIIDGEIRDEDMLIEAIKGGKVISATGESYESAIIRHRILFTMGVYGLMGVNRLSVLLQSRRRKLQIAKIYDTYDK